MDRKDVENLVDTFPGQSIDFFGALLGALAAVGIGSRLRGSGGKIPHAYPEKSPPASVFPFGLQFHRSGAGTPVCA